MDLSFTPDQDALREATTRLYAKESHGERVREAEADGLRSGAVGRGRGHGPADHGAARGGGRRRGVAHRSGRRRRGPRRPPRVGPAGGDGRGGPAAGPGRRRRRTLAAIVGGRRPPRCGLRPATPAARPLVPGRRRRRASWSRSTATGSSPSSVTAGATPGARSPAWPSPTSTWTAPRCWPRAPRPSAAYERGPRRVAGPHRRGPGRAGPGHARPRRAVRQGPPPVRRADRQLPGPPAPLRRPAHAGRRQPPPRLRGRVGARRGRAHRAVRWPRRRRGGAARWPTRRPGSASTSTAATASCSSTTCSSTSAGPRPPACCSAIPRHELQRIAERRWGAAAPDRPPSRPPPPLDPPGRAWTSASSPRPRRSAPRCARSSPSTSTTRSSSGPTPPAPCTTGASTGRSASGATWPPAGRPRSAGSGAAPSTSACSSQELYGSGAPIDGLSIAAMVGATLLALRHRRAEGRRRAPHPGRRGHVLPRLQRARRRLRRRRRGHQGRARRRRLGDRRARRCSRRWPTRRTTCSCSPARTPTRPSTRASRCSSCRWTRPGIEITPGGDHGRRAHQHHLLQRGAGARLGPGRRGRRRLDRDARRPRLRAQLGQLGRARTTSWSPSPAGRWSPAPTARRPFDDPAVRATLARATTELEVGRLLLFRAAWLSSRGEMPQVEGSMAKLHITEAFVRASADAARAARRRPGCWPAGSPARCSTASSSTPSATPSSRRSTAAPARSSGRSSPGGASACPAIAEPRI